MNTDFERIRQIFLQIVEQPAAKWDALLSEACANDPELRQQVAVLLQAHGRGEGILDRNQAGQVPTGVFESLSERPGTVIGPCKLLEQIGEGGMGTVFMAEQQEPVRRMVALKIIKPGMDSAQVIARFESERQALALMDHPNIAKVFDAGTTDSGRPFFVMELVKGIPITRYCDERRLNPRERLELLIPVCRAVQHAHQKGIIHRDLKPPNVLVALYDGKPVPKVIDFGVAKAMGQKLTERTLFTGFGALVGTLEYMSPEQAELNQLDIDTRSDIYSLGVLLYELLTGSTPLDRKQLREGAILETLRRIREEEPPRPSTRLSTSQGLPALSAQRGTEPAKLARLVRGEVDWIVMKALEKDRNRRYETANGLAQDIERYLADEPVQAGPPSAGYRMRKFAKRNRGTVLAASVVLVTLLAGIVGTSWGLLDALDARDKTDQARQDEKKERDNADRLAKDAIAARKLIEANLALERAKNHFERNQVAQGLHWLARGLEVVPEQDAELEHAFRMLLSSWSREIHPRKQLLLLPDLDPDLDQSLELLALSPNAKIQLLRRRGLPDQNPVPEAIELWDTNRGVRLGQPITLPPRLSQVVFSPDSKLLIVCWLVHDEDVDRSWLRCWDVAPQKPIGEATGIPWPRAKNFVSPDGKRLARVRDSEFDGDDREGGIQILEIPTGKPIGDPLPNNPGGLVTFSQDSQTLLTTGLKPEEEKEIYEIRLWDTNTGKPKRTPIQSGPFQVTSAAFSPDGQLIAVGGGWIDHQNRSSPGLVVRRTATGDPVARADSPHSLDPISQVAFSPDGKTLLVRTSNADQGHNAHLFKFRKPKDHYYKDFHYLMPLEQICTPIPLSPQRRSDEGEVDSREVFFQFSPNGKSVLLLTELGYRLWDTFTGAPIGEPLPVPMGRHGEFHQLDQLPSPFWAAFDADGREMLVGKAINRHRFEEPGGDEGARKANYRYRFGLNMLPPRKIFRQSTPALDFLPLPIGQVFYYPHVEAKNMNDTSKLGVWDQPTQTQIGEFLSYGEGTLIYDPVCSPDGRTWLTLGDITRLWDAATHKPIGEPIPIKKAHWERNEHTPFAFAPNGHLVFLGDGNTGHLWETATGKHVGKPLQHQNRIRAAAFSPDSKRMVTVDADKTAQIWDPETGQPIGEPMIHDSGVGSVAYYPDGSKIVTTTAGFRWSWDAATGRPLGKLPSFGLEGDGPRRFRADQKVFLAPEGWQRPPPEDWQKPQPFGAGNPFRPGLLVGPLRLWDTATGRPRGPYLGIEFAAFSPDGKAFVSGGKDGMQLWNTHTGLKSGKPLCRVKAPRVDDGGLRGEDGSLRGVRDWLPVSAAFNPDGRSLVAEATFAPYYWFEGESRFIEVPEPVQGAPERLRVWIEVITGSELDPGGEFTELDPKTWHQRSQRLQDLGGPPSQK